MNPRYQGVEDLAHSQLERFQRHLALNGFGVDPQLTLLNSHVVVIGAGGLGAPVLSYLAASGVGKISVVDADAVDRSNLHRQVIHGESSVGEPKTSSAARAMRDLHPEIEVAEVREWVDEATAVELLRGTDLVIDGSDNFSTRYVVADAAEILGIPVVYGAILRFTGQVSVFWPGRGPGYRDLFPEMPAAGEAPSCAEAGVLGVVPGVIGTLMATEAIKVLTGIGEPLVGRLMIYDALTARFREIGVSADPERPRTTRMRDAGDYRGESSPPDARAAGSCEGDRDATLREGEISLEEVRSRLREERKPLILDVREPWEHRLGALEGAFNTPLPWIKDAAGTWPSIHLDAEVPVILYCKSGVRSAQAREILSDAHPSVTFWSMAGGYDAWVSAQSAAS